ncbi:NAD(P)H-hydrate dehydratase [Arthrospiribacter ruber]|uniref:Bifunctional NAD(P)H-hydrate repair enzyme n=1 Tax=Arthrospiribacter ruber TaxID=2487934 RepID=A0A951J3P7_9BACT|nr:NAD(P)H-hydrate dehydratase [Arthrospiribacter ruber]MBW3469773.1 NAD(P)H-hydrate dehydratase [Arthrospiribacter ruber]
MLKILSGNKVSELDQSFIKHENISSWQLMERASLAFSNWFMQSHGNSGDKVFVFCGPGNNGGDGLAIARQLFDKGFSVSVVLFSSLSNSSKDWQENFKMLPEDIGKFQFDDFDFQLADGGIIIDALFGIGINRPLEGKFLKAILSLNKIGGEKIAIDIPSGLPSDDLVEGEAFLADVTVSFQFPKLSLLVPDHVKFVGDLEVVDLGIPSSFLERFESPYYFIQSASVKQGHTKFHKFSHKGDFGRVLFIGGRKGKVGAIILSAKAALRTGSGLVHVWAEGSSEDVIHASALELMTEGEEVMKRIDDFDALGIGPGMGEIPEMVFEEILRSFRKPIVLDADALNMIARHSELWDLLPSGSILTPHVGEFDRLAGKSMDHFDRLKKAKTLAEKNKIYLVLKGAYTCISTPDGKQYFNSTGTKHMATAGSGDVLTGILTSFLGQGYSPFNACVAGVYHHGLAGEIASKEKVRGTIASDILEKIPESFLKLGID